MVGHDREEVAVEHHLTVVEVEAAHLKGRGQGQILLSETVVQSGLSCNVLHLQTYANLAHTTPITPWEP